MKPNRLIQRRLKASAWVGTGVDLEKVAPFRKKKARRDATFFRRVFSPSEIAYCRRFKDPAPRFAARFCAKEALIKAANPHARILISDAEVAHTPAGRPFLKARSSRPPVRRFFRTHEVFLSLSHKDDAAIAFVVVLLKRRN
ncbi:MAG: 4'-phosphopantetheinyl transferase superfamily protein [Pseudomonadota bacterium]